MYDTAEILIVEDSPTQATELQYLLEAAGCKVRVARNGVVALAMVAERQPTIVISDIVMPEMDGYELCRQLKSEEQTAGIPVILVTRLADARDVVRGLACGADNFIVKPYDEKYLLSRIRYFLVNLELRSHERVQIGVEVMLEGERHFITASRQQILDLLISTYEQGVRLNHELQSKHDELARSNSLLNCLFHFTSGLTDAKTERHVIDEALNRILEFPEAVGAWLLLADTRTADEPVRLAGARGRGALYSIEHLQPCVVNCPCLHAWFSDRLSTPSNIAGCPALAEQAGECAHASIPLLLGSETIGMLNVVRRHGQSWPDEWLTALASIGRQLAMAVGRARLFESMEQLVEQRTLALAQSEALLRKILDSLPVGVLVADPSGRLIMSNPESSLIWGGTLPGELVERGRYQGFWAENGEPVQDDDWPLAYAVQQGKASRNRVIDIQSFDGASKTILNSAVPFLDDQGLLQGAIAVIQDVSEQRRRDLEIRIRTRAVEASVNAIIITDNEQADQPIVYVNPAFERITGYRSEEVLGRNCRFLQGEQQGQPALNTIRRALRGQEEGAAILRNYRKDGSAFWNDLKVAPVVNDRGKVSHFVGILHDITEAKRYQEELEHQANHDSLTGLPNRNLLNDRIHQAIALASRNQSQFSLVFMDLDHFKVVNDSLGHNAGDRLLVQMATRLQGVAREIDTVARLGGDEFVILLADSGSFAGRIGWLERLKEQIATPLMLDGQELVVSCSIGFCCFPDDGRDVGTLLRNADTAMYQAKHQGRNRICAFTPQMNEQMQRRLLLEQEIRHALHHDEFRLVFQPQLDLQSGRLCGFEALVRWQRKDRLVAPDEFIPLAEETGQIVGIDFHVFDAACRQLYAWKDALQGPSMSVNFSAISFMAHDFIERVQQIIDRHGVAPERLKLEVTESMLMTNTDAVLAKMQALSALGIRFSIDDFGTGYSSLGYLKRFPFSELKIDRSFVSDVHLDPDSASLARSMISIGHNLGLKVIAEGVETPEQLGFLRHAGCDELQGYYYSPPLPPAACLAFLQADSVLRLPGDILDGREQCLLLIDDDPGILKALQRELRLENYLILTAGSCAEALPLLAIHAVDVVLTDMRLADINGLDFLRRIKGLYPDIIRMVLSGSSEVNSILKAVNEGVIYRFLTKPWSADDLRGQLREAFRQRHLEQENQRLHQQVLGLASV
ncbi:EAL domain-containing protein [Pseudomonas borbori]|uniref:PAS domain S-box-containing protein/diguanylate cyclase (GGDEF) domain-containing protein n=1 Tax=Pseudomonas borbori TaxID=289003 RepID=A0A1I5XG70_9PSED|nr:EAL domain-containing protein [Pseudomonas borbori]SFQ30961.1 PAS domain S-box-containing protein/diguanylate cyclase (GGDEF) domain-containing protein [Pseudomonas borbori]